MIELFSYYHELLDLLIDSRIPLGEMDIGPDAHKTPVSTSIAKIEGAIYCFFIVFGCCGKRFYNMFAKLIAQLCGAKVQIIYNIHKQKSDKY